MGLNSNNRETQTVLGAWVHKEGFLNLCSQAMVTSGGLLEQRFLWRILNLDESVRSSFLSYSKLYSNDFQGIMLGVETI